MENQCIHCNPHVVCKWYEGRQVEPVVAKAEPVGQPTRPYPYPSFNPLAGIKRGRKGGRRAKTDPASLRFDKNSDVLLARAVLSRRQKSDKLSTEQSSLFDSLKGKFVKVMTPSEKQQLLDILRQVG